MIKKKIKWGIVMLSTRHIMRHSLLILWVLLLVGCGGGETKPDSDTYDKLRKAVNEDIVIETKDEAHERKRLQKLEEFGPNPYLSNIPDVPEKAKIDFATFNTLLSADDESAAEILLKKMVDAYPTLSGPAYNLAVMKVKQGDNKAALNYVVMAVTRNSNNLDARLLKAYIHRENGEFDLAEKEYLEAIELWGAFLPAYKNLGILYDLYMGKLAEALLYYEEYNNLLATPDKQVYGWSVDVERQMDKQGIKRIVTEEPVSDDVNSAVLPDATIESSSAQETLDASDQVMETPAEVKE